MTTPIAAQCLFLDGCTDSAQSLREQLASALLTGAGPTGSTGIAARPGFRYATGSPLAVTPSSGMTVAVAAGVVFVQGTASTTAGMYTVCLDTAGTITLAASDPTNPRIDNVIAQVTDVGSSSSTAVVTVQTGVPGVSPVAPTLPSNSILLAQVAVAALTTTITGGNITDARVWTAATGGVLPVANAALGTTVGGPAGTYVDDLNTGRLRRVDSGGKARAPKPGGFARVSSYPGGAPALNSSTSTTLATATVTVDGSTEIQVFAGYSAVRASPAVVGDVADFTISYSSVAGGVSWYYRQDSTSAGTSGGGTCMPHAITPPNGAVTVTLAATCSSNNLTVVAPFITVTPSYT